MEEKNTLNDLIGASGGQPVIIQESGGGDKKFLYTLLILLVVLFIIAIGVILFLGSKYVDNSNVATQTVERSNEGSIEKRESIVKEKVSNIKVVEKPATTDNTLNELENLVNEEKSIEKDKVPSQKITTVAQVASSVSGNKSLSQDDLSKIAKLVAMELAKSKSTEAKKSGEITKTTTSSSNDDSALVAQLDSAQTDTLKNSNIDSASLKDSKVNKSAKKVDTFNKVIVNQNSGGDDELAQLSSEIDAILQSDDVKKETKSLKYGKELNQEIQSRASELRFIVVKEGDTLSSLAYKAYGRASGFRKIYAANPDLVKNPNRIYVGMKLRVPVDKEYIKFRKGSR